MSFFLCLTTVGKQRFYDKDGVCWRWSLILVKGKIKRHSFLLGGKSTEVSTPLASLEGLGTDFDKTDRPGLDFTAIQTS